MQPQGPEVQPGDGPIRSRMRIVLYPPHLRRTLSIATVVGVILTVVNQGDVLVAGDATATTLLKAGFNFLVPFTVSNLGLLAGHHPDPCGAESVPIGGH